MFYLLVSIYFHLLFRKDKDVNEHERLSNFTLRYKLNEQPCYCCSTCSAVFRKERPYPIPLVKGSQFPNFMTGGRWKCV
jgi:hypothetical protein